MTTCKAFLFDMDGVLLDTEKVYVPCWIKAAESYGYELKWEEALNLRSFDSSMAKAYINELLGGQDSYTLIRNKRKELMKEIIEKNGIQVKKGVTEALQYLRAKKIRTAVVTAVDRIRAETFLNRTELCELLDCIITATDVKRGKPFPDIYLSACKFLNLSPGECIVVEDSPNDVMSAYKAGCHVIMIPDLSEPDEKLQNVIDYNYSSLPDIVNRLE